jgi:hypothetical protein
MLPQTHFLFGIIAGLIGVKLQIIGLSDIFIVGIVAVLIDLDHLVMNVINYRSYNLVQIWNVSNLQKRDLRSRLHLRQGFFIVLPILLIISVVNNAVGFILLGAYLSHLLIDAIQYVWPKSLKGLTFKIGKTYTLYSYVNMVLDVAFVISIAIQLLFL